MEPNRRPTLQEKLVQRSKFLESKYIPLAEREIRERIAGSSDVNRLSTQASATSSSSPSSGSSTPSAAAAPSPPSDQSARSGSSMRAVAAAMQLMEHEYKHLMAMERQSNSNERRPHDRRRRDL